MVNFLLAAVSAVFLIMHIDHLVKVAVITEAADANANATPATSLEALGAELLTFRWKTDYFYHIQVRVGRPAVGGCAGGPGASV